MMMPLRLIELLAAAIITAHLLRRPTPRDAARPAAFTMLLPPPADGYDAAVSCPPLMMSPTSARRQRLASRMAPSDSLSRGDGHYIIELRWHISRSATLLAAFTHDMGRVGFHFVATQLPLSRLFRAICDFRVGAPSHG